MRWFIRTFFPGLFQRMRAESESWIMKCSKCGHELSVWDAGGIRYKARGQPSWRRRCTGCGEVSWLKVFRRA